MGQKHRRQAFDEQVDQAANEAMSAGAGGFALESACCSRGEGSRQSAPSQLIGVVLAQCDGNTPLVPAHDLCA